MNQKNFRSSYPKTFPADSKPTRNQSKLECLGDLQEYLSEALRWSQHQLSHSNTFLKFYPSKISLNLISFTGLLRLSAWDKPATWISGVGNFILGAARIFGDTDTGAAAECCGGNRNICPTPTGQRQDGRHCKNQSRTFSHFWIMPQLRRQFQPESIWNKISLQWKKLPLRRNNTEDISLWTKFVLL